MSVQSTEGAETRDYWQTDKFGNADGWLQLGVAYSWFFNPVLRYKSPGSDDFYEPGSILGPSGGTMSESSSTLALSVGMLKSFLRYLAVGAFVTVYVPASLEDADGSFDHYEATMSADIEDAYTVESTETVHFDEMSVGLAFLDLQLHVAPHPPLPASLYLAGHIGSIFYDYRVGTYEDGDNESTLGYGVGLRVFPVRHVSAVLEFRRMGILTMESTNCGDAEFYVENCDPEKTGTFDASVWMNTVSIGLMASFY